MSVETAEFSTVQRPNCPCCGNRIDGLPLASLTRVPMAPMEREIVKFLALTFPEGRSTRQIAEWVYRGGDGGCDHSLSSVGVTIHRLRRRIKHYGWEVGAFGQYGAIRLKRVGA